MSNCSCQVGPGKFEGEPVETFIAWETMLNGFADEDCGRYAFVRFPLVVDDDMRELARDAGYCDACIDAAATASGYGIGLYETEQGFVDSAIYETETEWNTAVERCSADDDDEGDA